MPGEKTGDRRKLVLAAMIFAVAMTFIDQTIVSIAVPEIQRNLHLTTNGVQWVVNGYLLSLAAFFAFGGRLADMIGHSKMVVIGIVVFAIASTMCGLTPAGSGAEAWIVSFRVLQGLGGAIMYPAAVALVVGVFPVNERGRAMAIFFGVAGGLTAIGPILGGVLSQWTWRAIFWVNIPVAIVALILTAMAKPKSETRPAKLDVPGLVLVCSGVGLGVFGIQQTQLWGWGSATAIGAMVGGLALLVAFALVELRQRQPLISVRMFAIRAFLVENIILVISMACFIPIFFFASVYAQEALGDGPNQAGLFLLLFFAGFAPGVQVGGRVLDRRGAKQVVVIGSAVAAVGFELWSRKVLGLSVGTQWYYIALAGFGMGLMVGPANTDAINQAGRLSYGEATGITQTTRNFGASLGLAALGTLLSSSIRTRLARSLVKAGLSHQAAAKAAAQASQAQFGSAKGASPQAVRVAADAVAYGMRSVLMAMAIIMAVSFVVALFGLQRGIHHASDAPVEGEAATIGGAAPS
jgi:EmrB/QacA subfamily drug resistance transporter